MNTSSLSGNADSPKGLKKGKNKTGLGRCLRNIADMVCELEQNSLDAIFTINARGVITSSSQGGSELLGLMAGEAIGKKISTYCAGGETEARVLMERLKSEGRIRSYFTVVITPAGKRIPVGLSVSAIQGRAGTIAGIIAVAHDLTEIRRLEDELANKNRFMANILQDSADAIITLDPDDYITAWNRGAEAIFGFAAQEVVGRHLNVIIPPELRDPREREKVKQRLQSHGAVRNYQTERLTRDGRRIQVIFTRTAIRDDSGRLIGSSAVLKDVTIFRNLEKQLADAEHLATLGELSAGLAHEIKNPLAGIKGAIDIIRDSLPSVDPHREILGDVLHEVNRIDKIVRDLLNYAKPKPASHSDIHFPELVQRIAAMARQSSKIESLSIRIEQSNTIPGFTGDETQLEQVLLNLLLNAQNALRAGGSIVVRLHHDNEEMITRLEVEDNGSGMAEEIRRKIFQPFFTTRVDGTGLGLATCLKNVQYHGGSIDVRSEPGRGTKFTVSIPMLSRI
jgi:PAS domain S-box-containing protein